MRCERYGCASAGGGWRGRCGRVVAGQEVVLQGVGRLAALRRGAPPAAGGVCWVVRSLGLVYPGVSEEGRGERTGGRMRWCSRWFLGLPRGKGRGRRERVQGAGGMQLARVGGAVGASAAGGRRCQGLVVCRG